MSNAGSKRSKKVKHSTKAPNRKKVQLWGGIIEYDEPTSDPSTERIHAAIDAGLARFEQHKPALITILRDARHSVLQAEPFDETKSWSGLTNLAGSFFWQASVRQETMPRAGRKARLDKLAVVLKQSRAIVAAAMQGDVGDDLFSAWCAETNEPLRSLVRNADGSPAIIRVAEETFNKALASLATLETAALRAANHHKGPGRGRPKGSAVLPTGYIEVLASLYREATGARPGTGSGPFVRFVCAFLSAIGKANISEGHVSDLAQIARSWAHTHPSRWSPSPFDDQ